LAWNLDYVDWLQCCKPMEWIEDWNYLPVLLSISWKRWPVCCLRLAICLLFASGHFLLFLDGLFPCARGLSCLWSVVIVSVLNYL
jgi:hypothetical protein